MTKFPKAWSAFLLSLLLLAALPHLTGAAGLFKDMKTDNWAYPAVKWAVTEGIVEGYSSGRFGPQRELTESEFLTMLLRYDCTIDSQMPSTQASANYQYAKSKHLPLEGYTNAKHRHEPITRGEVASIVAAFEGKDLSEPHAIQYLYVQDISGGFTGKKDYADYGADRSLTRGEAAAFLHRLSKRGHCQFIGLQTPAKGQDDDQYPLPLNFMGDEVVYFPEPEKENPPASLPKPHDPRLESVDIEKDTLIANGKDSTFITLTLKDCYGNPIDYEHSMAFQASSVKGGSFIGEEDWYWEEVYPTQGGSSSKQVVTQTDGPELTVEVKAPALKRATQDTISFRVLKYDDSQMNLSCYEKPVTVAIHYVPQAELQVEASDDAIAADGTSTTRLTATIVRPGGQVITNYNGWVRFGSAQGAKLSNKDVRFVNGVASTTVTSPSSSHSLKDELYAQIIEPDPRYHKEMAGVVNKTHRTEIVYETGFRTDNSCPRDELEAAFVIDASSSMKRNDAERLRVSKTQEMMTALNAPTNIAAEFTSRGRLLGGPDRVPVVKPTIHYARQAGGTNIANGLEKAFDEFSGSSQKIAILLTDGKSNERQVQKMIQRAKNERIQIYTIGLGDKSKLNETLLKSIAQETGGSYYHTEENIDLQAAYQSILNDVSCGIPYPSCPQAHYVFSSPMIETSGDSFSMNTYVNDDCGQITKVMVRFKADSGFIDYELIPRGQSYFALKRETYEIDQLDLSQQATFLAYNKDGQLIGQRSFIYKIK
ncbi:VWA domain-containing protein [Bacillus thermotolerans]|uniref:VWA domain-containing protein n=1 Tax=Bacillus thermotolerans TaxID=1221996 RepID=A0A0F5I6Z8_BACTR|nr:VWA domain-containing protein [Bacillus thermotolerans]KKB40952.1 hypothetical protein QY95_01015 [Bacillus thermotolerans]